MAPTAALAALTLLPGASAAVVGHAPAAKALRQQRAVALVGQEQHEYRHYGDTRCPCIGLDKLEGDVEVSVGDGRTAMYPMDFGATCQRWDDGRHPDCKPGEEPGPGNGWCRQAWCYVNTCDCDLPILPKLATYVPDATIQGKPVFFSYATCGGKDTWSKAVPEVGTHGCRCIGFDNIPGTIDIRLESRDGSKAAVSYPAEIGGSCTAWDEGTHPSCTGTNPPKWCFQRWCYVDPCACDLPEKPKVTMYLPDAAFAGMSLYYSYETCGSKDHFTEKYNVDACVNQKTETECLEQKLKRGGNKCAWTGHSCFGWEIVEHPLCTKMVEVEEKRVTRSGAALPARFSAVAVLAAMVGALAA